MRCRIYNTVACIDADGTLLGTYRKTHIPDDHYYQEKFYFTPGDTGFRVFRVDESNMEDVYYHPEELTQTMLGGMVSNIKPDRTDLDLLYGCLLDWGVEISLSHTQAVIDSCTVHNVDNGALCACFDERVPLSVIDYMAKQSTIWWATS